MKRTKSQILSRGGFMLAALLVLTGRAFADYSTPTPSPAAGTIEHADRSFIEKAAKYGMEEVALAQVAMERATNPQVKEFARMLVNDHTAADQTLSGLASTRGVSLSPQEPAPSRWMKKSAKDFDEDFIEKIISGHETSVKLYTKEADEGKDQETVGFARKTLPILQHHLEQANDLKKQLKS